MADETELQNRVRLATLAAVADSCELFERFVFKGGLALQLAFGSPRQSSDLDFDAVEDYGRDVSEEKDHTLVRVCHALNRSLKNTAPRYGIGVVHVQRKRLSDEIPTVMTQLGYDEDPASNPPCERWVEMQVTLCEVVCETTVARVGDVPVHVPVLEDIIAEKLKAMAQQVQRRRARSMDVFDIWYFTTQFQHRVDVDKIASYFRRKTAPLGVDIHENLFADDLMRAFSGNDYSSIRESLSNGVELPPFETAFGAVVELVDEISGR